MPTRKRRRVADDRWAPGNRDLRRAKIPVPLQLINIKIGITGLPGAGKTQALKKVIEMLEQEGVKIGGMITEPIVEEKHRKGFQIVDWMTQEKRVFAHLSQIQSKVTIGRYKVDLTALDEVGVPALKNAIEQSDLIVIDEVGKMELESESFVKIVKEALDAEKPLILTLFKKSRNPLLQDIRRRDDIRILEVTTVNKNLLPFKIHKLLLGEML